MNTLAMTYCNSNIMMQTIKTTNNKLLTIINFNWKINIQSKLEVDRSTNSHLDINPFLPGSHTNFVFTQSGKWPAPVTDMISASAVLQDVNNNKVTQKGEHI